MLFLKLIFKEVPGPLVEKASHKIWKKSTYRNIPVLNSSASPYFNGLHTLIIQCLSMIDCLIRAEVVHVLRNNLCWTLLCIVIFMHKDLLFPQPRSTFVRVQKSKIFLSKKCSSKVSSITNFLFYHLLWNIIFVEWNAVFCNFFLHFY